MMENKIKDISLSNKGEERISLARRQMPVMAYLKKSFSKKKPLKNIKISASLHITKETAVLAEVLTAAGAKLAICGSNPSSTQDDVAAYLAENGIQIYAWKGQDKEDYDWCINKVLEINPDAVIDDGADLIAVLHQNGKHMENVKWAQEETTTGVKRLRALEQKNKLKIPVIAVNDALTKRMFDNVYGTGISTIDGIMRATHEMITGKTFVVVGYGYCGTGVANRARGTGANVIVTEIDPIKALQAHMDGFRVMSMKEASKLGDIFVTTTGNKNVIRKEHMKKMKDGTILANSGHFNVEISIPDLESLSSHKKNIRDHIEEFKIGNKSLFLLAEGRLVNLVAAEGHPSSVIDMSFGNQVLCCVWGAKNYKNLKPKVYMVPQEIDEKVASLKLELTGIKIDKPTKEQEEYSRSWEL